MGPASGGSRVPGERSETRGIAGGDGSVVTHPRLAAWRFGYAVGSGQIGDQSELPFPGPGEVAGPSLFQALLFACAPAWLLPGKNDQPDAIGPMTDTP